MRRLSIVGFAVLIVSVMSVLPGGVTHACSPAPEYWNVNLRSITVEEAELPIRVTVSTDAKGLSITNGSDEVVLLMQTVIEGGITVFSVAPSSVLDISYTDASILFSGVPALDTDLEDEPTLPETSTLLLQRGTQRYEVPVTLLYDVQYTPPNARSCQAVSVILLGVLLISVVGVIISGLAVSTVIVGVLLVIGLGIWGLVMLVSHWRRASS
jgi:hypothetical protein